ncbi:hypothetical protein LY78DRAFT_748823 [Colletotrichum sublineola]|nr:hypothetical protein LY78DRAFT_748823 [Colletotrichum sublineola]
MTGVANREFKLYQVREAFTDYKTYLLFFFYLCMNVPTGGLVTFAAQIVSGLGYGKLETTLLGMPTGMVQSLAGFMLAIPQRWLRNKRCLSSALCCLIPIACSVIIRLLSLVTANVSGHTKKLTVSATVFLAYCIANIVAPQVFIATEAPHYTTGYNAILGFEAAAVACLAAYGIGCAVENKRRGVAEGSNVSVSVAEQLGDLTDYEKKGFRYVY